MKKVLIIVTNHATLGETDQANGTYTPELTHALSELLDAGFDYDIASIKGGVGSSVRNRHRRRCSKRKNLGG